MPNPAHTTDYSDYDAKAELAKFFHDRSVKALEDSIQCLCDRDYYKAAQLKIENGADLSDELPEIKKLTTANVLSVLTALQDTASKDVTNTWELKGGADKVFSSTVRVNESSDSNIPCFDVEYVTETDHGHAKVKVTTWRRNVEVNVLGSVEAAEAASKKLLMAGMKS